MKLVKPIILLLILITYCHGLAYSQELAILPTFFPKHESNSILVVGEIHTSSATVHLFQHLFEDAYKKDLTLTLFIEDGSSSAFLLNSYLRSGNEQLLDGFFLASFEEWVDFWKKQREYIESSNTNFKLNIVGYDFERLSPLLLALEHIQSKYSDLPNSFQEQLTNLKNHLKTKNSSNYYPSNYEELLIKDLKKEFNSIFDDLKRIVSEEEIDFVGKLINNPVEGFAGQRENQLFEHSEKLLSEFQNSQRILLTGEGHADYSRGNFVFELKKAGVELVNLLILLNNSKFWPNHYKFIDSINLKKPWKKYPSFRIVEKGFRGIDLKQFKELLKKADFAIVATQQEALVVKGT